MPVLQRYYPEEVFRNAPLLFQQSWVSGFTAHEWQGRPFMNVNLTPEGLEAIAQIIDGVAVQGPVPALIDHQDEALAAARRDANEAKQRAAAAEAEVAALREEIADYQGELEVAKESRTILSVDPASLGGVIVATSGSTGYTHAQQKSAYDIFRKAEEERQRRERERVFKEPWHIEYGLDGSMATVGPATKAALEKLDPFTYGDS